MTFPPPGQHPQQPGFGPGPGPHQPGPYQPGGHQPGPYQSGPQQPGPGQPGPYQAGPHQPGPGQLPPPGPRRPRMKQKHTILPIIAMVFSALGFLIVSILILTLDSPGYTRIVAFIACGLVSLAGLAFYRWLDRWEPEPPFLLIAAFLWGAGFSTFWAIVVNEFNGHLFGDIFATVISAPFGEEGFKSLFMVLVLLTSARGRRELNSLTDALIYAGIVGLGFTFVEDILYIVGAGQTPEELGQILIARIGLGAFGHSLYQSIFAVGLWAGIRRGGAGPIIGFGALGYFGAVFLHFLHNFTAAVLIQVFGILALVVVLFLEFAIFVAGMVIAIRSSIGERKNLARQLPAMVHFGWLTPREAGWLADMSARKRIVKVAAGDDQKILKDFIQNATELAHLRTRLDASTSQPSRDLLKAHAELAELLVEQRPVVDGVLGQNQGGGWAPIQGQPAPQYPPPGWR